MIMLTPTSERIFNPNRYTGFYIMGCTNFNLFWILTKLGFLPFFYSNLVHCKDTNVMKFYVVIIINSGF